METWNRVTAARGEGGGGMMKRRGRDQPENMYEWPMDMGNGGGIDWVGQRKAEGEIFGQL